MLTFTTTIYNKNFIFELFGSSEKKTQMYIFFDDEFDDEKLYDKLIAVLDAINSNPLLYSHDEKFKLLTDDIWEIKINQLRIGCLWDKKPLKLIALYAFYKKRDKWPPQNITNVKSEKIKYLSLKTKTLEGDIDGRNRKIQKKTRI